jgi:hypothetical protein
VNERDPLDQRIDAALRARFAPPPDLAARVERTLSRRRRGWNHAFAAVLAAAALVLASVWWFRADATPVLDAKELLERVSHWGTAMSCTSDHGPAPTLLPGPKLGLGADGQVAGPFALAEWPEAAVFRIAVAEQWQIVVHAVVAVARADAGSHHMHAGAGFLVSAGTVGELQVFDFHPAGTPAVAERIRRLPD